MDTWGLAVTVAAAFVGGTGFSKLIEVAVDRWKGRTEKRRTEIDRMSKQLSEALDAEDRAARRVRITLEHASELRRMLLDRGVTSAELPVLDLGE